MGSGEYWQIKDSNLGFVIVTIHHICVHIQIHIHKYICIFHIYITHTQVYVCRCTRKKEQQHLFLHR